MILETSDSLQLECMHDPCQQSLPQSFSATASDQHSGCVVVYEGTHTCSSKAWRSSLQPGRSGHQSPALVGSGDVRGKVYTAGGSQSHKTSSNSRVTHCDSYIQVGAQQQRSEQ